MFYALVYYPDFDTKVINDFRRKYDPFVDLIDPHVTFMFLVPETVGEAGLVSHIEAVLARWPPFRIRLTGLEKAWDHWLYLILEEGSENVIRIYQDLYTGILTPYRRDDMKFVPHVGLGFFARQGKYDIRDPSKMPLAHKKYRQALKEANALDLDYTCIVDKLHLLKLDTDLTEILWCKKFFLHDRRQIPKL